MREEAAREGSSRARVGIYTAAGLHGHAAPLHCCCGAQMMLQKCISSKRDVGYRRLNRKLRHHASRDIIKMLTTPRHQ